MPIATPPVMIIVGDPRSRDAQLEEATAQMRKKAAGCGILVTRISYSTFKVALSPEVAFGITREIDLL